MEYRSYECGENFHPRDKPCGEQSAPPQMVDKKAATAADIGTATHAFLEFCDFGNLSSAGIDAEISRLLEERFLSPETTDLINREQLNLFLKSPVLQWILEADEIYKEQQFNLSVPLSALTSSKEKQADPLYQKETVLVQGSIDLLICTKDGRLLLIDYKTDHISLAERKDHSLLKERMIQKHGNQLSCYHGRRKPSSRRGRTGSHCWKCERHDSPGRCRGSAWRS